MLIFLTFTWINFIFHQQLSCCVNHNIVNISQYQPLKLLCKIYKDTGYYYQWGEDEALLFEKRLLGDSSQYTFVNKVVEELVKRNFFDKDIFEKYKILTSHGIQERYDKICKDSKRIYTIDEKINLLGENSPLTREKPGVNRGKSTQSKVKKIKEKQKKLKIYIFLLILQDSGKRGTSL